MENITPKCPKCGGEEMQIVFNQKYVCLTKDDKKQDIAYKVIKDVLICNNKNCQIFISFIDREDIHEGF